MAIKSLCNFVFIMGNHEEMMLDGLDGGSMERVWLNNGGLEALQSYGGHYEDIPEADLDFLRSSLDYWETETEIFIHANLQPGIPLEDQDVEWLRWSRLTGWEPPHPSGKRVLCGHTPQTDGRIRVLDGWIGLDTWAYHDQFLTGLDVTNDIVFQTSQSGKVLPAVQLESFA
jgi:serine/threonine protein phosphatase 1